MGWLQHLLVGRHGMGAVEAQDAAQAAARNNILANAERDRIRARRLEEQAGEPTARWRRHGGVWERWSELEARFAAAEPPETLLDHADRSDLADDVELVLVDGAWGPATAGTDDAVGAVPPPPPPPAPVPPPPPAVEDDEPSQAEFEAQLAAWRRRR